MQNILTGHYDLRHAVYIHTYAIGVLLAQYAIGRVRNLKIHVIYVFLYLHFTSIRVP